MNSKSDPQEILKIQQAIRQTEDKLVQWIESAMNSKRLKDLKNTQFRGLVRVASTTQSTEVIKNFLRYQFGRDSGKWGELAEKIIRDIGNPQKDIDSEDNTDTLLAEADQIATNLLQQDEHFVQKRNDIWLTLIRLYLGYGARYLFYLATDDNVGKKRRSDSENTPASASPRTRPVTANSPLPPVRRN